MYDCTAADARLMPGQEHMIPSWCPLTDFPAAQIAERDFENAALKMRIEALGDIEAIEQAAEVLKIETGHDPGMRRIHRFGQEWWTPLRKIEERLRAMLERKR